MIDSLLKKYLNFFKKVYIIKILEQNRTQAIRKYDFRAKIDLFLLDHIKKDKH